MQNNIENEGLHFEGIAIGQTFKSGAHKLDEAQIKAFARQFDPQPFHLDNEAAKNSMFGGLVASGWHVCAITMRLIIGDGSVFAGGIIGNWSEISWLKPVRPGDVLHVRSEVIEKNESKSHHMRDNVMIRSETSNQNDDIVQIITSNIIVPRRYI